MTALSGRLATELPTADVDVLLAELKAAGQTDARVARVLSFYADGLSGEDRYLVALVSLFQAPVKATTIVRLGSHETCGEQLAGWTTRQVERAVRQRLSGLLTWHSDGAISGHPLVRDTFRPLALSPSVAELASELTLADLPDGNVRSRSAALRVVEMIELLIEAGDFEAADEMYRARANNGLVWFSLPAARLGQRCAAAFVATPARREECERVLDGRARFYLNEVGLFANVAGDLYTAMRFLEDSAGMKGGLEDDTSPLVNLADTHFGLGDAASAKTVAATVVSSPYGTENDRGFLAMALFLNGETKSAEEAFLAADRDHMRHEGTHLPSYLGTHCAEFLLLTRRENAAGRYVELMADEPERERGRSDEGWWSRVIALRELDRGAAEDAGAALEHAITLFRDGDMLVDLARTLGDLAEQRRRIGALDEAERLCKEAIALAGPRSFVPTHAAALTVRARVHGDRYSLTGEALELERARDDAEHALRLATVARRIPWQELAAIDACAAFDALEGRNRGWQDRAAGLRAALIPPGLDPDPLATVERDARSEAP